MHKLRLTALGATLAAAGATAALVPAAAMAHRVHPHGWHHQHPCRIHDDAYRARGTISNWSLTQNANKTWSGSLTVNVLHGNDHAKGQVGTTTTYTITDARVHFGIHATNPPAASSRVQLYGRALVTRARCTGTGPVTQSYAIHSIWVHQPATSTASAAAAARTLHERYTVTVDTHALAVGNTVKANATITNPDNRVKVWWSAKTVAAVVRKAVNGGYQKPFLSQGYRCTPSVKGSRTSYRCVLQGADVATRSVLTFSVVFRAD